MSLELAKGVPDPTKPRIAGSGLETTTSGESSAALSMKTIAADPYLFSVYSLLMNNTFALKDKSFFEQNRASKLRAASESLVPVQMEGATTPNLLALSDSLSQNYTSVIELESAPKTVDGDVAVRQDVKTLALQLSGYTKADFRELDWQRQIAENPFYRIGGLTTHDLNRTITPAVMVLTKEKIPTEEITLAKSAIDCSRKLIEIIQLAIDSQSASASEPFMTSGQELKSTLIAGGRVQFSENEVSVEDLTIDDFSQFICIRTLVMNALTDSDGNVTIERRDSTSAKGEPVIEYVIKDDGTKPWKTFGDKIKDFYDAGSNNPKFPGAGNLGGGGLVAFLSGQDGVDMPVLHTDPDDGTKDITVQFKQKGVQSS